MLAQLSPVLPAAAPRPVAQPTLFPLPPVPTLTTGETGPRGTLPLPRPVMVPGIPGCVGVSREMGELGRRLGPVANSGVNVLLRGESGTGKEIVARALHECSDRRKGPFLGQNCAALPGQPLSVDYRVIPRRHAVYEASDCRGPGSIRYRPCTSKRALRASWG
ncbi:MAG: sigma-54 factor interaction domain-containing protein [bacterium]|nr:sigma-54 factor interaction domain-containing protein [bacterium]